MCADLGRQEGLAHGLQRYVSMDKLQATVALHFVHYNFVRIHSKPRMNTAMATA
jgi:hypothetical protein